MNKTLDHLRTVAIIGGSLLAAFLFWRNAQEPGDEVTNGRKADRTAAAAAATVTGRVDRLTMDGASHSNTEARSAYVGGNRKMRTGDYGGAEAEYRRAADLDPSSPDLVAAIGASLEMQGKADDAEVSYGKALGMDPKNRASLVGLANVAAERHQFQDAIEKYERVLAVYPDEEQACFGLANAWREVGDAEKSRQYFAKYLNGSNATRRESAKRDLARSSRERPK